MGEIQNYINEHLTVENSFVKSIQIVNKHDDEVIVPKGFNIRFINCAMTKLTARDSALHMLSCSVDNYNVNESILSLDGGEIREDLNATNCRINIKELPGDLVTSDTPWTQMDIDGSVHLTNCESFWNKVNWKMSKESTISNSRVELTDCELDFQSKLTIEGSDWYCIKGSLKSSNVIEIKELEAISGGSAEQDMTSEGKSSPNNIRGSAGVGAGSICHFKSLESIEFSKDGQFKVEGSECNIFDVPTVKSQQKPIISYKNSCGKISKCSQWESPKSNIEIEESGNVHASDTKFKNTDDVPTIKVSGEESSFTMLNEEVKSEAHHTFECHNGTLELYNVKMDAQKDCVFAEGGTIILYKCPELKAKENVFETSSGAVIESNSSGSLDAEKVIFKGDNSSFILRGETSLKAGDKDVEGSGVFVTGAPDIAFKEMQDLSKYIPTSG